jgi:hypothetical protein
LYEYNPQEAEKIRKELSALSSDFLRQVIEKIKPLLIDSYCIHLSLFYLSIITFPHAVTARYPNDEINPLEIYRKNFPLVELFKGCAEKMEKIFVKIEHVKAESKKMGGANASLHRKIHS